MNRVLSIVSACLIAFTAQAEPFDRSVSGSEIMQAVYEMHEQYPYVYEEQSMILIDRNGHKETRKLKRYSRVNMEGTANFLLLFESPVEVKGVAMLASRTKDGDTEQSFFLPAFGDRMIRNGSNSAHGDENFLGTDYSIENLIGEGLDDNIHVRADDQIIDERGYYVIDVFEKEAQDKAVRRHFILHDNLFIARTDHYDEMGRLKKRQTQHDLVNVHGDMWRSNMMLMENKTQQHRTVIKIDRRIFSADYVPEEVFTARWIIENAPRIDEMPGAIDEPATEVVSRD